MEQFVFKDTTKSLEIVAPDGEKKEYKYDVGNFEQLQKWTENIERVDEISEKLQNAKDDSNIVISDLKEMEENVISMILGSECWNWVWEISNHNVFACLQLVKNLSKEINKSIAEFNKGYV